MSVTVISEQLGNAIIFLFLVGIPLYGYFKKVPVYDTFVEGAKNGFPVFLRVMPYMLTMLVAIGMLRASGAFDLLTQILHPLLKILGIPAEVVPIVLMRPFSGGATMAASATLLQHAGPDAFVSHLGVIIAATTEATFYIIAVYFGVTAVSNHRHAVLGSIFVDIVGILSSVWLAKCLL